MIWIQFLAIALVIVLAGTRLARYGDVLGEKSGLGASWIGLVLLAATTSLPELFTGLSASAMELPDIAVGDVVGSCMFNLLVLSFMDAIQKEPLSARAHQGHALSIGLGLVLCGVAGLALAGADVVPSIAAVSLATPVLVAAYFVSMRTIYRYERDRRRREAVEVARDLRYADIPLRSAVARYAVAAAFVVAAATQLPAAGAEIARQTGMGEAFVGSLFIAVTTSLPEVVVSLAAVRLGAVDLGVGNLLGSNLFNLLILGVDDVAYRPGSLLASVEGPHGIGLLAVVLMNGLFLTGLTSRVLTKRFAVSWDTGLIAVVYVSAVVLTYLVDRL